MARTSSVLTNSEIEAVAYLASLSPNFAVVTDGSGLVISSVATATEVSYLSGVTSNIQTQLNSKPGLSDHNTWTGTNTFSNTVLVNTLQAGSSAGILLESNNGTDVALFGAGGGANATFYGAVALGSASGSTGSLMFKGTTSGTVTLSVTDIAGTWTMKLPDSAGTTGQALFTDGLGNTYWDTVSGGSFSWGATASGTSATGIGLTIGASASASTTMISHTWDNTQVSATYGHIFNYGTSTTAKYGQYHDLTTQTGAIPMYIYYNNGTAFTSPGIFFQKAAGATIGGSTGALKFATLVDINSRIGTGIYFDDLTGGTASTLSTAYGIRFGNGTTTSAYAYLIKAGNLTNSTGYGYALSVGYISNGSGRGYMMECSYGAYLSSGYAYGFYVSNAGANGTGSTFAAIYVNALSVGSSANGYLVRAESLVSGNGANGYGMYIQYIMGNVSSGTGVGYYVNNLSLANTNNIGAFWYLNNSQISVTNGYNRAASMADMRSTRSVNTAGVTINDTYNVSEWRRFNGATNATATMNAAGAIGYFENAVYGTTTGTLNDTVTPIKVVQHSLGSGAPIAITQNYVTSTNFRKLETETNTGHAQWVSNGTSPNGALTGTTGDVCYNADGGKIYYCTGTTNWTLAGSSTQYPEYIPANVSNNYVWYSDNTGMMAIAESTLTQICLSNSASVDSTTAATSQNMRYLSGTAQTVAITTIWAAADSVTGLIIQSGYVYVSLYDSGGSNRIYRCAVTSDITAGGNWTQLTISGTALQNSASAGIVGYGDGKFWVIDTTNGYIPYILSGTTLTSGTAVTVTGSTYNSSICRVNGTGIYAFFGAAPCIRFASFAGTLDGTKQVSTPQNWCFVFDGASYTKTGANWSKLNF